MYFMKMKLLSGVISGLCIAVSMFVISCKKDDNDMNNNAKTYNVAANASGSQVVPAVTTTANSTLTGTYNSGTNKLQYNISWTGLAATASSVDFFGPADPGANASGAAQFNLTITTPGMDGNANGEITLTDQQETDLLNGKWYYTVSNATYTSGEIRGQLTTTEQ
jgi:CHRD domain